MHSNEPLQHRPASASGATEQPAGSRVTPARRADLDWLRVLAVLLLVPFHAALIFLPDPGLVAYVKNSEPGSFLAPLVDVLSRWQLEVLFFIAGAASWFALARRSIGSYLIERVRRLLVPFLFGLFTLIPFMLNVHWLGQAGAPSLAEIYARFFTLNRQDMTGMSGSFTPAHLWFILYLFVFSLVALPIFLLFRLPAIQRALSWLSGVPGIIALVYLFFIPLAYARSADLLGLGDKAPLYYLLVCLSGYVLTSQARFQQAITRSLWLSLALALAATVIPQAFPLGALFSEPAAQLMGGLLFKLSQWTWLLAILGAGYRWLNHDGPGLRYATEAAYPFYILHLPVATLIAALVIQLQIGVAAKYALVVVATTLATLAIYDLVIKHVSPLRFCFGMKPLEDSALLQHSRRQPLH